MVEKITCGQICCCRKQYLQKYYGTRDISMHFMSSVFYYNYFLKDYTISKWNDKWFARISNIITRHHSLFSWIQSCSAVWIAFQSFLSVGIYLFKTNDGTARTMCVIFSKLTIKTPEQLHWRRSRVFIQTIFWCIQCWLCSSKYQLDFLFPNYLPGKYTFVFYLCLSRKTISRSR